MQLLLVLVLVPPGSAPGTALESRTDSEMGETKFLEGLGVIVSPKNEIFLHAGFDEGGLLVTGGNEGVVQDEVKVEVEVVLFVEVVEVVDFVGFVRVQGKHAVGYGIEGVMVEKMVVEEMGMASAVELVEGEAERHWRGLPKDPQGRAALNTFFGSSLSAISPPLQVGHCLHRCI